MRRELFALMFLTISAGAFSQDNRPTFKEVGLIFSNLNSFGIRYKYGNDNCKLRITSLALNGTSTTNSYSNYTVNDTSGTVPASTSNSIGAGLNLGLEKTAQISTHFSLHYGFDWVNTYTRTRSSTITPNQATYSPIATTVLTVVYDNTSNSTAWTAGTGIGFVGGLSYSINDIFSIGAELEPTISYKYTKTTSSSTNYSVRWSSNTNVNTKTTVYTSDIYTNGHVSQTTVNKGFTGSLANTGAGIVIICKL